MDWVTVSASIDPAAIQAAWTEAYGKAMSAGADAGNAATPPLNQTRFLRVEMERQEQLPNGTWGTPTAVPALKIYKLDPMPPADGTEEQRLQYLEWAAKNEATIATPAFYEWANKGKPWHPPGAIDPASVPAGLAPGLTPPEGAIPPVPFDPANPPKRPLTPDEKKMVKEYQKMLQDQKKMERDQRNPPKPPRGGGGVRGPRPGVGPDGATASAGGLYFQDEGSAPVILAQFIPPSRGPGAPEIAPYRPTTPYQPTYQPSVQPDYQPTFQPNSAGGGFDVATLQQPPTFWAHDENVLPGKTYRYRLRYSLLNPVHQVQAVVANPKLADTLYLTSPWGEWTEPVTVSERIKFWLAGLPNSKEAKFEVFTWKEGAWKSHEEKAAPGDMINGTSWMLVDLRANSKGGGFHVILVNAQTGTTERREPQRDQEDPSRLELQEESAGAPAAAAR
jgi:hypothetical protein